MKRFDRHPLGPASRALRRASATVLLGLNWASPLGAEQASGWVPSPHSAARLIDAGPDAGGPGRLVGLEIRLDPPFITYWRSPGEAGVPPRFDFAASDNLAAATVLYPAPRRLDEDGSAAFGYDGGVIFPVLVAAQDPARPVTLDVALDYAVCAKICLPARAALRIRLAGAASAEADEVRSARRAVPVPRQVGEAGPLRIDGLDAKPGETIVRAITPDGTGTLFAEGPEPWYVQASPGRPDGAGRIDFSLTMPDRPPPGPLSGAPLRLTLVGPDGAIEIAVPLDEAVSQP